MWKSIYQSLADLLTGRRYDGATAIYVHCTETIWSKCLVTWYASLAKTNARSTYMGKEKELCVRAFPRVRARVWNVHAPLMGEDQ